MNQTAWVSRCSLCAVLTATIVGSAVRAESDLDIYMLKLVNRARVNPSAEPGIIGSAVTDPSAPVPPLAWWPTAAVAARNHNEWMHWNFGEISTPAVPDSFTHYETLDGLELGTPATSTTGYTGVSVANRMTAAGFPWDRVGENLAVSASSEPLPVTFEQIDFNHFGWWESAGHRANMLNPDFTVFGHEASSQTFTPPLGGLPMPFDNIHYATQNFARPLAGTKTYIFGLLFEDADGSGDWTPTTIEMDREGLNGVAVEVYTAGSSSLVASGTTYDSGAFSINVGDGTYDVVFATEGGDTEVLNVTVSGANVDIGDIQPNPTGETIPGDCDGDTDVDLVDFASFQLCFTGSGAMATPECVCSDLDNDGDVDLVDFGDFQLAFTGS